MKRNYIILFILVWITTGVSAQDRMALETEVRQEALSSAGAYLSLIPEGREKDYGFEQRSDFPNVKIENPYRIYYMVPDNEHRLKLIDGNEWRVPLSVNGNYVALLTIQFISGKPVIVDFGANILAQKIQEFESLYRSSSNDRVLIRNTFLSQDFATMDFSSICSTTDDTGKISINLGSSQLLYRISESLPVATNVANLYTQTMNMIVNTSRQ